MTRWLSSTLLFFSVVLLFASCARREALIGDDLVVLEGGAILRPDGTLQPDAVLVLQRDRISRVGSVGEFEYPSTATIVDARGRFVLPGFIDMHVHVPVENRAETLRTLLAYGVTTIRSPGAYDEESTGVGLRERIARGEVVGPRMFGGGAFVNGIAGRIPGMVPVGTDEEIRAEVRRQAKLGADWVKLYWDITPPLLKAAVKEAHAHGLRVAGHLRVTSWTEAARAGIDSLEHSGADGPTWELVTDLSVKERLKGQDPPRPKSTLRPAEFYRLWVSTVNLHGNEMESLVMALRKQDVTVDPTLVVMQSLYFGDDVGVLKRLEPERMPPPILATWSSSDPGWEQANPFVTRNPIGVAQDLTSGKLMLPIAMQIVRMLHERGVRITTGSDVGMPWITTGVSLHRELELLVEAGISPQDVLLMASRNGAQALGKSSELGTIEPGKLADLVVLRENPLRDIRNTRNIEAVYRAGRRYEPEALLATNR